MPRLIPLLLALVVTALVAGCQLALPGGGAAGDDSVTPNAVAGDPIEVTALDAPPAAPGVEAAVSDAPVQDAALAAEGESTAQAQGADPVQPAPDPAPEATPEPAPVPEAAATEPPPPPQKSERQLACEKDGGTWAGTGTSSLRTCVFATRDGGKQCSRKDQCDGQCLARSGTCSPVEPLLGCNDVLQNNGARVTLCID
ncbi:hypothetical protein EI545_16305 [Tabrizicola piscis]|uniref:Uncharacterized protein n=1 Tax=Tabrizicola piscis TaxID=2494374 RepID=A0A3S8U9G9_9RHOB|nr:hypothetical protein [Tabrizicola piscis]AZL60246.1 hypothetical protein EI545_16305 [Tabrizicola piscis]